MGYLPSKIPPFLTQNGNNFRFVTFSQKPDMNKINNLQYRVACTKKSSLLYKQCFLGVTCYQKKTTPLICHFYCWASFCVSLISCAISGRLTIRPSLAILFNIRLYLDSRSWHTPFLSPYPQSAHPFVSLRHHGQPQASFVYARLTINRLHICSVQPLSSSISAFSAIFSPVFLWMILFFFSIYSSINSLYLPIATAPITGRL